MWGLFSTRAILGSDANNDGDESADSELLSSNYNFQLSLPTKPPSLCTLDRNIQDMCKHTAAKINIAWPTVQTKVLKSQFDDKSGKHVLPVFPELLKVTFWEAPYLTVKG